MVTVCTGLTEVRFDDIGMREPVTTTVSVVWASAGHANISAATLAAPNRRVCETIVRSNIAILLSKRPSLFARQDYAVGNVAGWSGAMG
ncbi:hypothetical protein GCM10008942_16070 [Rhizomicrobium electricum]|uniref:Uncharacterized protein n=1 Tax=Rhizomicrobium electricum TaxID=480070 RepID=A0ABN1ELM8_9PROT